MLKRFLTALRKFMMPCLEDSPPSRYDEAWWEQQREAMRQLREAIDAQPKPTGRPRRMRRKRIGGTTSGSPERHDTYHDTASFTNPHNPNNPFM